MVTDKEIQELKDKYRKEWCIQEHTKNLWWEKAIDEAFKIGIKSKSQELRKRNPYPEDIFIPLTKEKIKAMSNGGARISVPGKYDGYEAIILITTKKVVY